MEKMPDPTSQLAEAQAAYAQGAFETAACLFEEIAEGYAAVVMFSKSPKCAITPAWPGYKPIAPMRLCDVLKHCGDFCPGRG